MERAPTVPEELQIRETGESISYLGVKLEKARNTESPFVPDRSKYESYVEDRFTLDMQKRLAISFQSGDPIILEGGTSLGKTTTVRKMCAELGYEVYYVNLNGATDVEDLMGRYVANRERRSPMDPEFAFADGKVTSGLRQEEGKKKVIILDEINAASPSILIRLHEVLDALERNERVVLSEDAAEGIDVDKGQTKMVGLMNPPGKGYIDRQPMDPAQLRRWVYQKLPDSLPEETLENYTNALAGLERKTPVVHEAQYLFSNEEALSLEDLKNIDGLPQILEKYREFHRTAQELVAKRRIAADQPQKFMFDDRMEPARVIGFIRRFYRGDITDTTQQALRYYYVGKVGSQDDRAALELVIENVRYDAPQETRRRGLGEREVGRVAPPIPQARSGDFSEIAEAERRVGRTPRPPSHERPRFFAEREAKEEVGTLGEVLGEALRRRAERGGFTEGEAREPTSESAPSTRAHAEARTSFRNTFTGPEFWATDQHERSDGIYVGQHLRLTPGAEYKVTQVVRDYGDIVVAGFDDRENAILSLSGGDFYVLCTRKGDAFRELYSPTD